MAEIVKTMPITSQFGMGSATTGGSVIVSDGALYALRRRDLYRLADAWGVEYSKDAPATEMRQLLASKGIDGTKEPPKPYEAKPKADIVTPEPARPSDYESMKFFDLRKACKDRGIKFVNTDNKNALIDKLRDADFHGD